MCVTLGVAVDADVNLATADLGSVHHPAGLVSALWGVKPDRTTALRLSSLHLNLCKHHLATDTELLLQFLPGQVIGQLQHNTGH